MPNNKRKPTQLKVLQGTARRDRLNPDEPCPDVESPEPPDFLLPAARDEWDRIVPILIDLKMISKTDQVAIALYCQTWGRILEVENILKGDLDADTHLKYLRISNSLNDQARKFITEFGLSPASRSRVSVIKKEKSQKNPFLKQA